MTVVDVLVAGAGPAGRAVAAACSDTGLRVALVDPAPQRAWPHTYGLWQDELPAALSGTAATVSSGMRCTGKTSRIWERPYVVLDNVALWKQLWRTDITEITGRVAAAEHGPTGSTVHLKDGRRIAAGVVVDASGPARALSGGRPQRVPAQQTAVGVVVGAADAKPLCDEGTGVFMDWRPAPGTRGGWPTFLYAVANTSGSVLLEETSLARRPALPLAQLRRRLRGRLAEAGIPFDEQAAEERVRFPVDDPAPPPGRVVAFGVAGGFVHPASGFSVAASLRRAPWVASAIAGGLQAGPATAARSAWSILWPPSAVAARNLRLRALQALLLLPPDRVPEFFDLFFGLSEHHRVQFLSAEADFTGTARAMTALFRMAPWRLRRHMMFGGLLPGRPHAQHGLGGI